MAVPTQADGASGADRLHELDVTGPVEVLFDLDGTVLPYTPDPLDAAFDPLAAKGARALLQHGAQVTGVTGRRAATTERQLRGAGLEAMEVLGWYALEHGRFEDGSFVVRSGQQLRAMEQEVAMADVHIARVLERCFPRHAMVGSGSTVDLPDQVRVVARDGQRTIRVRSSGAWDEAAEAKLVEELAKHRAPKCHALVVSLDRWGGGGCRVVAPRHGATKAPALDYALARSPGATVLYAGDDANDLPIAQRVAAYREATGKGMVIAVRNPLANRGRGTPAELIDIADVVVDGPRAFGAVLSELGQRRVAALAPASAGSRRAASPPTSTGPAGGRAW